MTLSGGGTGGGGQRLGTIARRPHTEQLSGSKLFISNGLFPRAAGVLSLGPVFSSKQTNVTLLVFRTTGAFGAQTKAACGTGWLKRCGERGSMSMCMRAHHAVPLRPLLAVGAAD